MVVLTDFIEASPSSSSDEHQKYDVFISFRGADTRLSFTSHLHKALINAGLAIFYDDHEIETGDELKPELEKAIKASRASVIVLSKDYASSTWCLNELVLILEQLKTSSHIVIPIFYHVEPTDVRKQQNRFENAMEKHKEMMEAETDTEKKGDLAKKIEIWKEALTQVANLKGQDVKNRQEAEFIEEIVEDIHRRLGGIIRTSVPQLIGMEYSVGFITWWLKDVSSLNVDVLTIWGIGGIGKTSVADYVYKLHHHDFEACSFIEDISRVCAEYNGILGLQKQLLGNILKTSPVQVHRVSEYTSIIENVLSRKKVFLVLDDIDSVNQLDALLGTKGLHPGSKLIITTKNASLIESCALFNLQVQPTHTNHLLDCLYDDAAIRLLWYHAFGFNELVEGYGEVSDEIVKYCGGHPLALKVLGKSLHNRDVTYWVDFTKELKKGPEALDSHVNNALKVSFDSLKSKNDKDLFKHIACYFVGTDKDIAETILKACKMNTISGITNLVDRCLLHIGSDNKLMMHSLIQAMGRDLVEAADKPEERSLLWRYTESYKVLKRKTGTRSIKGLSLDMKMIENEKLRGSLLKLETDALSKMDDLKLLLLKCVQLNGCYKNFPKKIRCLCMQWFPLESLPSDLPMKKLVVLDMSHSSIKSFGVSSINSQQPGKMKELSRSCSEDNRVLGSLKILILSHCYQLHSIIGFSEFPALERLYLRNCTSLVEVCETINQCQYLFLVDFSYCTEFKKLLAMVNKLKNVQTLRIDGLNFFEYPLNGNNTDLTSQTSSSVIVKAIPQKLMVSPASYLSLLSSLSLAFNNLSCESFPMELSCLSILKFLDLSGNPIVSMPDFVRTLPRLETLYMYTCKLLASIEHPPRTLKTLVAYCDNGPSQLKILLDPEMTPLDLWVKHYVSHSSILIEGRIKIQPMTAVKETVLRALGWSNLEFTKKRRIGTIIDDGEPEGSQTQMYYVGQRK